MICDKCQKNSATIFYRENYNGKEAKYALCKECAAELEKSGKMTLGHEFAFNPFFYDGDSSDSIFGTLFSVPFRIDSKKPIAKKTCTLCGSTFDDLRDNGKVGCPKCYEVFSEELAPAVERIHRSLRHSGRAPSRLREKMDLKKKISSFEKLLREAVKAQEFERAAELRDELKALKGEGGDGK